MTLRQKRVRLVVIAAVAALIAGSTTGTLLTIDDEAWPGRGGIEAVFQISLLFTGYALLITLPVGLLLSVSLSPLMLRPGLAGPIPHLLVGALLGLAAHLLVDAAIREQIDSWQDFLGGTLAGGAAGLLWWFSIQRNEEKARAHG